MKNANCPLCNQQHDMVSIETIYFDLINTEHNTLNQIKFDIKKFSLKSISPPQLPHKAFALHTSPDIFMVLIVAIFLLIPFLFSKNLTLEQALGLIIVFVFYIAFRSQILKWQKNRENNYHTLLEDYKVELDNWKNKYYCPVEQEFFRKSSMPEEI